MKYVFHVNTQAGLIQALENRICEAGADSLGAFGGTWVGGYRLQQNPAEFAAFLFVLLRAKQAGKRFDHYLEIGSAAGGTARMIQEVVNVNTVTVVDDGSHPSRQYWPENSKYLENLIEVIGDSRGEATIAKVRATGRKFDLFGIDGDHAYESVKADWNNYKQFLNPGAVVWFHDTIAAMADVGVFWEELKDEGHRVLIDTQMYLGIGALEYRP